MEFRKIFEPYNSLFKKEEGPKEKKEQPKEDDIKSLKQLKSETKPIESKLKSIDNTFNKGLEGQKTQSLIKELATFNFIIKIIYMVKKDLKLLIRSKSSALIFILGPLLTIFLIGMSFNTSSLYDLRIGVYSESYSDLSNSILSALQDQQYRVIKVNNQEECIKGVKFNDYQICASFPANMQITNESKNIISLYVDESRINLAYLISSTISTKVSTKSSEVGIGLANDLITKLGSVKTKAKEGEPILVQLETTSNEASGKLDDTISDFNNIDLNYNASDFNFSKVYGEVNNLINLTNKSAAFSFLKNYIDDLKLQSDLLGTKLNKAVSQRDTNVKVLNDIKNKFETDFNSNIKNAKSVLTNIQQDVDAVKITNAESIVSPIKTSVNAVTSKKTHLSFIFPTIVIMIVMFISILLASTLVIREKTSKAYFRNFITPTASIWFMISLFITNILLVTLQIIVIFSAATYFFQSEFVPLIQPIAILLTVTISVFILIGMFIGYIFNSEETATLASISVGSIMLFFSNTILPLESLPKYIRDIALFNPFVISQEILKSVILFNANLSIFLNNIYILLAYALFFFVITFFARELTKRRL